jgi:hypothetical protein
MSLQALGGTTTPITILLGFILFMNQNNKPDLFLLIILGLFFCLLDSTLAITSWHTITTSYYSTLHYSLLYFWFIKEMDLQLPLFNLFLSGVLVYDDEGSFINCVASNY